MPDKSKFERKFKIKIDEGYGFGLGICFQVSPRDVLDKRDICLVLILGRYSIRIGMITDLRKGEEDYEW